MTPLLAAGLRPDRSFERIYRRHVGDVYRYALAVLRNPADAEDVTQTTFMNAYRAYAGGERPRQPQNWLIAIAHNVCRQRFRQSQRRPQEVMFDENVGEWLEEERGPNADDLRRALSHLAFNQRAALVMRELEGRSYSEIAEILGLTVAAVETLIFRARRALREQLEGTLTCAEAERALSLEADSRLPRSEKGPLRAHLRECKDCAAAARRQRAQRSAWKALGALPVPASLSSLFGGGGAAVGVKAAAVAASAIAAGGLGFAGERHFVPHQAKAKHRSAAKPVQAKPTATVVAHASAPVRTPVVSARAETPKRRAHGNEHRKPNGGTAVVAPAGHEQGNGNAARTSSQGRGNAYGQAKHSQPRGNSQGKQAHTKSTGHGKAKHHGRGRTPGSAASQTGAHGNSGKNGNNGKHTGNGGSGAGSSVESPQPASDATGSTGSASSSTGNGQSANNGGGNGNANGHGTTAQPGVDLPQLPPVQDVSPPLHKNSHG